MKKLIILLILLLLNYNSFSQTDTSKVCYSYRIAKLVAIDLIKGDSAQAELKLTQTLVNQLEEKNIHQDTLIKSLTNKNLNLQYQINNYEINHLKQDTLIKNLEQDNLILNNKYQFNKKVARTTSVSTLLLALYIIFMIKP